MPDIVNIDYKQTEQSKSTNQYGIGEMQVKLRLVLHNTCC